MRALVRERQADRSPRAAGADLGPTVALTITFVLAGVGLLIALVTSVVAPVPIPGLPASQRQSAETALYLASFGIVLPLACLAVPRVADRISAGPNAQGLSLLGAVLAGLLAMAVLAVRLADVASFHGGRHTLLAALLAWAVVAAAALARATRSRPWGVLARFSAHAERAWRLDGLLLVVGAVAVVHTSSISGVGLLIGIVVAAAIVAVFHRAGGIRLPRRVALACDAAVVALILLAVPDLVVITPEAGPQTGIEQFLPSIMQFHHDFIAGPANQVLGGATVLRDTASQYGVGSIYFVAAWFKLVSPGYGTFALLDGLLTAAMFGAAYVVLRLCRAPRLLAAAALAVGIAVLVYNREYPVGLLPQEGPLRFGLPMGVVTAAVLGARFPARAKLANGAALAFVAISSLWALEAFAYTVATYAALVALEAYLRPEDGRLRVLARHGVLVVGVFAGAQIVFVAVTLAASGHLPEWNQYLAFLHAFLFGKLGDLTYDVSHWSPGLAVGAAYLASAVGVVLLVTRRPDLAVRERVTMVALTGLTAYGVVSFVYFVDRSEDHVVAYISLPALLAGALWLTLLLRSGAGRATKTTGLAVALAIGVLASAVAWSGVDARFGHSALGHLVPGGNSTTAALKRMHHFPPLNPKAPAGERLLARFMPGQRRPVVLVEPDLTTEILLRSNRSNGVPLSDPREDDFTPKERLPPVRRAVARLHPGERLLTAQPVLAGLASVKADPRSPLLRLPTSTTSTLQLRTLLLIDRRFRLVPIHRGSDGYVVVRLAARR